MDAIKVYVEYPEGEERIVTNGLNEIYNNDETFFVAHLENPKGKEPLIWEI